jgi:branched-chain amino acid aminotransferase
MESVSVWKQIPRPDQPGVEPVSLPQGIHTLDEASLCLPGGAYTTMRTYAGNKVLYFREHVHRLEESSRLTGFIQPLDEQRLRIAIRNLLQDIHITGDVRLRLSLDLEQSLGELYLLIEPLVVPARQAYQQGVQVITCDIHRQLPEAKLTRFIDRTRSLRGALPPEVNEAIMLDGQDRFLEGLSSNFFAILGGQVCTAEQGVLSGITRAMAIDCARQAGLSLDYHPPSRADLSNFDEAFITSSSRGILPVRQIDQISIGRECPGPVTSLLMESYQASLQEQLEPI